MRAIILGISGASGRATATELARAGWEVSGTGRDPRWFPPALAELGVSFSVSDRHDPAQLDAVLAGGADLVVDTGCKSAEHARELLKYRDAFGSAVVLSSKAVYVDDHGRHANTPEPPDYGTPITESQRTMEPDFSGEYASALGYGANKVAAEITLLESGAPITVLRPSLIHGDGARQPREWFVLDRLLKGRRQISLARGGRTGNHPTAAVNLARLVTVCAEQPGSRVLNIADPGTPTAFDCVGAIAMAARRPLQVVGLDHPAPPELGWSPWAAWPPVYLDTSAAESLGYRPVGSYAETVGASVDYLAGLSDAQRGELDLARWSGGG